jgi:hypothetical protein
MRFQWRRNGVNVVDGPGGAGQGGGVVFGSSGDILDPGVVSVLTISGATAGDSGLYSVVFSNACGSSVSVGATVRVSDDCPADLNGDGVVDGGDLGQLLAAWGTASPGATADLNADGSIDGFDLAYMLAGWGTCAQ